MKEKYVLIGAGSAMFTRGLLRDLINTRREVELSLVDIDPQALAVAEALARKMIAAKGAPIRLSASVDRRQELPGATAVVCTVGVGGRRAWEQDVQIPRKYGVYQPVGDTIMAGGSSRALRMIPAMVDIARDVLDLAAQALLFNYGNPMSPNCRAIRKATGANVVGLCHGVVGVAGQLAQHLGVTLDRMKYAAVGINHLTWFVDVRIDGQDAMPQLRRIARQKLAEHVALPHSPPQSGQGGSDGSGRFPRAAANPFAWWCVEHFGAYPAVNDVHVVEFFPHLFGGQNAYYGQTCGVDYSNHEQLIARGDRTYEQMLQDALSAGPLPADYFDRISGEHEQVIEIIDSIRRDSGRIYSANLPNTGQAPNLLAGAVIECPAVADAAGLRAIAQPPLPAGIAATVNQALNWVETVVEAALQGSRDKFVQALILDGSVRSPPIAEALADELLAAHAKYLPQFRPQT